MKSRYLRRIHFAVFTILLVGGPTANAQLSRGGALEWRDFVSEAGGFSVKLPGIPVVREVPVKTGPIAFTRHTYLLSIGDLRFEVDYIDAPPGSNADLALEGGITGLIGSMTTDGATLLSKGTITRGACQGRDATLSLKNATSGDRGYGQGRMWSSGPRYYYLVFFSKEDTPATRELARTFVESFTITGACTTAITPQEASPPTVENFEGVIDPATGWLKIEAEGLGVKVLMPAVVRHQTDQPQVKPFPLTHHTYIHSRDGTVYSAEVFGEYPLGFFKSALTYQSVLDITLYSLKKNLEPAGFEFTPLRDLRVGAFPGREFSLDNEKIRSRGRAQIYVTRKHVFVFMAFARDQGVSLKLLDQFFASIRVTPE